MATVGNKKGRFSKTGVVLRAEKIGELKTSVVKDKPHTQLKKTKMNHTVIMLAVKNYLKAAFVVCDPTVERRVCSMWGTAEYCTPRNRNYNWTCKHILS